jgi:hypothetical protein
MLDALRFSTDYLTSNGRRNRVGLDYIGFSEMNWEKPPLKAEISGSTPENNFKISQTVELGLRLQVITWNEVSIKVQKINKNSKIPSKRIQDLADCEYLSVSITVCFFRIMIKKILPIWQNHAAVRKQAHIRQAQRIISSRCISILPRSHFITSFRLMLGPKFPIRNPF